MNKEGTSKRYITLDGHLIDVLSVTHVEPNKGPKDRDFFTLHMGNSSVRLSGKFREPLTEAMKAYENS